MDIFSRRAVLTLVSLLLAAAIFALPVSAAQPDDNWFGLMDYIKGSAPEQPAIERYQENGPPPKHVVPLPVHTIDGVGGGFITPSAYLTNPGAPGTQIGMPSASFGYFHLGHKKSVQSVAVTQTFFRRIELGYALNRLGLGTLPNAVAKIRGTPIGHDDIYLHHFNLRAMLVEENSCDLPLPAITAGIHFKYNSTIRSIENHLKNGGFGGQNTIGFEKSNGVDYTLTASKTFDCCLPMPVIVSVGLRGSTASHIGFGGFGDVYRWTVEGNVTTFLAEWLAVTYEFRMKNNPFSAPGSGGLLGDEDNWQGVGFAVLVNENLTVSGGVGFLGSVGNTEADGAWGLQVKYEF